MNYDCIIQGIGDSGQGFVNALLFCVFTPRVRNQCLLLIFKSRCLQRRCPLAIARPSQTPPDSQGSLSSTFPVMRSNPKKCLSPLSQDEDQPVAHSQDKDQPVAHSQDEDQPVANDWLTNGMSEQQNLMLHFNLLHLRALNNYCCPVLVYNMAKIITCTNTKLGLISTCTLACNTKELNSSTTHYCRHYTQSVVTVRVL